MPASQPAATERRNDRMAPHEPPKLKTTLKTPPKQATNPLQFVKVGPCSLYRTAQEQLQKVQEVKKIKQEVRDDPEDWQSNLDNWKSSRRKRQEHIIERVVEVKKLELEEHDRQRRRSKTFSEMMEERGNRGRKLSISLAMYHEEDANDLSDLGIGTSSGKSSVSGDTHDDTHSVLSDRDSEIEKNHSDVDNTTGENGTDCNTSSDASKKPEFGNGFSRNHNNHQEYDSATTATASSPEPEEYTYEGAIRGYVSRVSQNIPRRSLASLDTKLDSATNGSKTSLNDEKSVPMIKVDILKRREIFEKASQKQNNDGKISTSSGRLTDVDFTSSKSIKERLTNLEMLKSEADNATEKKNVNRLSNDMSSVRERLSHLEKQNKAKKSSAEEVENARPLRERLPTLEKFGREEARFSSNSSGKCTEGKVALPKHALCFREQENRNNETSTPSERSSSPDSEYRAPRAPFHRSLDSLDADASSGPDTFERVQSLEELDYTRRYPASSSSAEILNDTDREDSGIHTADVSCSVSQADEPVDDEVHSGAVIERHEIIEEEKPEPRITVTEDTKPLLNATEEITNIASQREAVVTKGTADTSSGDDLLTNKYEPHSNIESSNTYAPHSSSSRLIVYQSPRVPPRRSPPEIPKPKSLPVTNKNSFQMEESQLISSKSVILKSIKNDSPSSPVVIEGILKNPNPIYQTNTNSQETKSPLTSPRSPSKIPTPLPRKSLSGSASSLSSPTSPSSSPKTLSPKPRTILLGSPRATASLPSEIPIPIAPSSPKSTPEYSSPRKVVVEEARSGGHKVVGGSPTPRTTAHFSINRFGDEEPIAIEEMMLKEGTCQANSTVDYEEVKTQAALSNREIKSVPLLKKIEETAKPEKQVSNQEVPKVPEKPSILNLTKSNMDTQNLINFLSPLSPVSMQILPLSLMSDEEIVTGLTFPLGPPTSVEPPKEKPPPPPADLSDEENHPIEPLKRLNSTRRIKKELRSRRSDFLGIEGINDIDLERELTLTKPPDIAAILAEERRIEQLHRRSYDTDSNYEQDSSYERDSGVELGHVEDWTKQPVSPDMSQHSRQSSEPFGTSVTSSEEDEITKKEREIIEVLEKEEQWRYGNNRECNSDIGEKLAHKLRELEEEKMQLERERAHEEQAHRRQEETLRKNEENIRKHEEIKRIQEETNRQQPKAMVPLVEDDAKHVEEKRQEEETQEQLRIQNESEERERCNTTDICRQDEVQLRNSENSIIHEKEGKTVTNIGIDNQEDEFPSGEVLKVERELLQLEQEELKRQRTNLAYREQKQQQLAERLQEQWKSLQDVAHGSNRSMQQYKLQTPLSYRASMPNLQLQDGQRRRPPPPPIPPVKPVRMVEQRQRDVTIRNSRIPSADSIPQQVDSSLRHSISAVTLSSHAGQQMSRQTLQALSAVPRPRIVQGDQWVQRRKSDVPRGAHDYNYQHWLIQEAEQRRISEINQRSPIRKPQQHATGMSVPYVVSPPRSDSKPLPDSIIQTLTQRVQNRVQEKPLPPRRRLDQNVSHEHSIQQQPSQHYVMQQQKMHQPSNVESQEKMLSVSGKKKCSHCGDELGRGAAMIIESLRLFYHMECFKCCVCHVRLGDGLMGTDVRVRNHKLHCHNCYSSDDGVKFSCV